MGRDNSASKEHDYWWSVRKMSLDPAVRARIDAYDEELSALLVKCKEKQPNRTPIIGNYSDGRLFVAGWADPELPAA